MRIAAVAWGFLLLGGCGLAPVSSPSAPAATNSDPSSVQVGVLVVPGVISATDKPSTNPDCASVVKRFTVASGDYAAVVLTPGCPGTTNTPENGDHGYYPTPPPRAKVQQAETPVGTATLFTNQYSECTSSCYMGGDEVALVTVDGIVVQIIAVTAPASGSVDRNRADLVQLLQTLRRA